MKRFREGLVFKANSGSRFQGSGFGTYPTRYESPEHTGQSLQAPASSAPHPSRYALRERSGFALEGYFMNYIYTYIYVYVYIHIYVYIYIYIYIYISIRGAGTERLSWCAPWGGLAMGGVHERFNVAYHIPDQTHCAEEFWRGPDTPAVLAGACVERAAPVEARPA